MFKTNLKRSITYNAEIIEWDIKSGNISMMEAYNLYPLDKIIKISKLPKEKRNRTVGYIMQKDKIFAKELENSFNHTVESFLKSNELDPDFDVLSIKRDAIFVINHDIKKDRFIKRMDDSYIIQFIPKNHYHAAILLPNYEFYLKEDKIDVKGLDDTECDLHKNGILLFISEVISRLEKRSIFDLHDYTSAFVKAYKHKELPFEYYREFAPRGGYRVSFGENDDGIFDELDENDLNDLNISYNYKNIILPILETLVIL